MTASLGTLGYEDVGAIRPGVFCLLKCLHLADKERTAALYLVRQRRQPNLSNGAPATLWCFFDRTYHLT